MKFIFMLLVLFVLTDPVLAKPVDNTSECMNIYSTYINQYGSSKFIPESEMLNFIGRCLPDDSANNKTNKPTYIDGTQHHKLLKNINNNKTATIKA